MACPYSDWRLNNPKRPVENPKNWEMYTVGPGVVHMDGDLALWYARSRLHSSDFDRGRRQQELLRALYARALDLDVVPRLPELYTQMRESITTDISLNDLLSLAPLVAQLRSAHIRSFYINNKLVTPGWSPEGASVLYPNKREIQAMLEEALSTPRPADLEHLAQVVEVCNATSNPGWEFLAAERLHYAGYSTRPVASCSSSERSKTVLFDLTEQQSAEQAGAFAAQTNPAPSSLSGWSWAKITSPVSIQTGSRIDLFHITS
jgi:hypothetical protein